MTELALGGAPLGGLFRAVTDQDAIDTLAAAWGGGIRSFDTAPHYGLGLSETRMGRFLARRPRSEFRISTKVGRLLLPDPDFIDGRENYFGTPRLRRVLDYSADGVRRSLEASLERLGLDRVDQVLIHDPDDHWQDAVDSAFPALARLRSDGVVDQIGVGMNQVPMLRRFVAETDLDCVMVAGRYTLLDRSAEPLLAECAARGVRVVAAGVFNSGVLADPDRAATFDYTPASAEILDRARTLNAACERYGVPLPALALRFVANNPLIDSVVIGARTAAEVRENLRHWQCEVPDELLSIR